MPLNPDRPHQCNVLSFALDGAGLVADKTIDVIRHVAEIFSGEVLTTPQELVHEPSEAIRMPGDDEIQRLADAAMRHAEINHQRSDLGRF